MKVNKKLMSFVLSLVMITNGLSYSTTQAFASSDTTQEITTENKDDDIKVNINGRDYIINDEGATYVVEKETGLTYLDYESSIIGTAFDAWGAVQSLDQEANNHRYYDSPSVGERFYVPKTSYNKGKMAGICVSEDSGNIDWQLFSKLYDFAYINCYDFRNDSYDEKLNENIKGCEQYNIPYGLSTTIDFKYTDDVDSESIEDAKLLNEIVSKYNSVLPTLLKIDNTNYEDIERLSQEYGLADYIMSDTNYYSIKAASYISDIASIFGNIRGNSYGFTMTEEVYQKIIEINNNFPDENYLYPLNIASFVSIYEQNSNVNYKVSQVDKIWNDEINGIEIDCEKIYINDEMLASKFYDLNSEHMKLVKKTYLKLLSKFGILSVAFLVSLAGICILWPNKNKKGSSLIKKNKKK